MEEDRAVKIPDSCVNSGATQVDCRSFSNGGNGYKPLMSSDHLGSGEGSSILARRSSAASSPETILSTCDNNMTGLLNRNSNADDDTFAIVVDKHVVPILDKLPYGWNSETAKNCGNDVEAELSTGNETSLGFSVSGLFSASRTNGSVFHNLHGDCCDLRSSVSIPTNDVVDSDTNSERVQCSTRACSSSEFRTSGSERRGRLARKTNQNSRGADKLASASINGHLAGVNNQSVWQEVRRTQTDCAYELNDENGVTSPVVVKDCEARLACDALVALREKHSRKPISLLGSCKKVTEADPAKESCNSVNASVLLSKTIDGKIAGGLKRKPVSGSKRWNHYTRKISHAGKLSMVRPSKGHVEQKEKSEVLPLANHNNYMKKGSSPSSTEIQKLVVPIGKSKSKRSEIRKETVVQLEEAKAPVSKECDIGSGAANNQMTDLDADDKICSLHIDSFSSDQMLHGPHSRSSNTRINGHKHEPHCDLPESKENRCINLKTVSPHGESSKLDANPGSALQKWVPVGRKCRLSFETDKTNFSAVDDILCCISNMNNPEVEVSYPDCDLPISYGELEPSNSTSQDGVYLPPEAEELTDKHLYRPDKVQDTVLPNDDSTYDGQCKCSSGLNDDLDIIVKAVKIAYQLQTALEDFQVTTGSPVAELERFLHFASPVLSQIGPIKNCMTCHEDPHMVDALCRHQIPSMSLGSLWRWYEKPGCYGLEVKLGRSGNSKKSRLSHRNLLAYFVPYLSAVQLFGCSMKSLRLNDGYPRELMEASEVNKESKVPSSLGSLPIFSKLLPQPHREADPYSLEISSSTEDKFSDQSSGDTELAEKEVLFEYFESAEPHHRRPLFEKIKALSRSEVSSNCQISGDPLNLECLNLRNLHPASWYSVAWYPIYRIPDGQFRAAFLTYHALGHFAYRRTLSNRLGGIASIVSPVVGLQSYNAKGECWFELNSHLVRTGDASHLDPSKLHRERLEALERTASVMARASVQKGNQRTANRQPDYEFFLSRRR